MPNVKSGTLVKADEMLETIKLAKQGQIEFRINENADIMVKIGMKNFKDEDLQRNFEALAKALQ